jgi:hypothetical protein
MTISADQIDTYAAVKKVALPRIIAAIDDGRIKTMNQAHSIVTPDKDEKRNGLSSEAKQLLWLANPSNIKWKSRQSSKRLDQTTVSITDRQLKALIGSKATVIVVKLIPQVPDDDAPDAMAKLAPKPNRALRPEGKQWKLGPI